MNRGICSLFALLPILTSACAGGTPSPTPSSATPWIEEEVTFAFGPNELHGILTLPSSEGPYPAIVLIYGSADIDTGTRRGVSSRYFIDQARKMVLRGFSVLRYDPPGVGQSTGDGGFESLDDRTEEAMAAVRYLQSRPDILSDEVGLYGVSQGAWVIAMAAAGYPQDVAFVISVSGSGVSAAEQQVHSIEAQSRAAGMSEEDITRAVLVGRALIDWQLDDPVYREVNALNGEALGDGPWIRFLDLVYDTPEITPAEGLERGIEILRSIQDEPWAEFLYLKELYIPGLEGIALEQVEAVRAIAAQSLLDDPQDYLTRVRCPVLAVFGENDLLQPTEKSAALYEEYLKEAGNGDVEIVVIPGVGHSIYLSTPGYWEVLSTWLDHLDRAQGWSAGIRCAIDEARIPV